MKFVGFREWRKPLEEKAKARGVKLSNKNIKRLNPIYFSWAMNTFGNTLNTAFKAVYHDAVTDTLASQGGTSILSKIKPVEASVWHQPVVLGGEHGVVFEAKDIGLGNDVDT